MNRNRLWPLLVLISQEASRMLNPGRLAGNYQSFWACRCFLSESRRLISAFAARCASAIGGRTTPVVGSRRPVQGENILSLVRRTGRPVRIEDYANDATGIVAEHVRELGVRSAVGAPIVVEGRLWGVMIAASLEAEA